MATAPQKHKDCEMCEGRHKMVPIPKPDGTDSDFVGCPNCDNPKGNYPKLTDPR
jgi:hypothetical protein